MLGFAAPREAALLTHTLGETCARSMLLEAAVYSATDMLQRGFLTRTVAEARALQTESERTVSAICRLGPASLQMNKQGLRDLCGTKNRSRPRERIRIRVLAANTAKVTKPWER